MTVSFESKLYILDEERQLVLNMLPSNFETRVTDYSCSTKGIVLEIRTNIDNKNEALCWKKEFEEKTKTTFNSDSTYQENTQKTVFKRVYHCLHNTRPKSSTKRAHYKNTRCQSKLIINVKQKSMKRSKDIYLKQFPTKISLRQQHNHRIDTADALRHKKPSDDVRETFVQLFSKGHSPSSALECFKIELQDKKGEDYISIVADGSKCPTRQWCYQLYYSIFKKEYGDPSGPKMVEALKDLVNKYNLSCNDVCAAVSDDPDDLVISICSPLMKRVHKLLKSSSEIMFVDSSGNMDRHNSRVFLLLCPSVVGALPIAIIITYNESEKVISKALALLKSILGDWAFHGSLGPKIIITDDSTAERQALKTYFPNSILLLCKFHVLQSIMRYLWDGKHGIYKNDRIYIYNLFHNLINIQDEEDFFENFSQFVSDHIVKKYEQFLNYIENYRRRYQEWAMCYRKTLLTRGNDTNNYCEATFKVLKEKILYRMKAFSIVQMFDYLTSTFERYYERRISESINNRLEGKTKSKYFIPENKIQGFVCSHIGSNIYKVISSNNEYYVNTLIEMCTCFIGKVGAPCKHQYAVAKQFNLTSQQFLPISDPKEKILLAKLINCNLPDSWFKSLIDLDVGLLGNCTENGNFPNKDHNEDIENEVIQSENIRKECSSSENITVNAVDQDLLKQTEVNFNEVMNLMLTRFRENPSLYLQPVNKFCELVKGVKTDSAMISALHTFGKYSGLPVKKNCQGSRKIGVQPTAVARRKVSVGGRNVAITGRPPKRHQEHVYSKRKRTTVFDLPPTKKSKVPHSLSFIIDNDNSL